VEVILAAVEVAGVAGGTARFGETWPLFQSDGSAGTKVEVGVGDHERGGGLAAGDGPEAEHVTAGVDVADLVLVHQQEAVLGGQDGEGQAGESAVGGEQQPSLSAESRGKFVEDSGAQTAAHVFGRHVDCVRTALDHVAVGPVLGRLGNAGPEEFDHAVDVLDLPQVDHLHVVGIPRRQDEGQVACRLQPSFAPSGDGLEVEDVEANELDEGDTRRQGQGHGAAVGGAELPLEVHLGELPGQLGFEVVALALPLGQLFPVTLRPLRSRSGEGLACDLAAQGGPLLQLRLQVRVGAAEHGIALGGERLGGDGLAAQYQLQSKPDGFGRPSEMAPYQGEKSF
jgi:hypothetical protein